MEIVDRLDDKQREATAVYRTTDAAHPGVARCTIKATCWLAGPVYAFERPMDEPFAAFRGSCGHALLFRRARLAPRGGISDAQSGFTALTSTSRRRRSRSATACC